MKRRRLFRVFAVLLFLSAVALVVRHGASQEPDRDKESVREVYRQCREFDAESDALQNRNASEEERSALAAKSAPSYSKYRELHAKHPEWNGKQP